MTEKRSNRFTLLLLFTAFLVPPLLAWYLLNFTDVAQHREKSHHGDLIHPARPLPDLALTDLQSDSDSQLHGKWTLLYRHRGACQDECVGKLYKMRQLQLATGKYSLRVQRVMVIRKQDADALRSKLDDFAGQRFLFTEDITPGFSAAFDLSPGTETSEHERLYLIDPLGNLMMSYGPEVDPRGIIEDLQRLIKNSRIG